MKKTRKLIFATLMLFMAFAAVVASTYAWFTAQDAVEVDDIELSVITDSDIQISWDGQDWGYILNMPSTALLGELDAVTLDYDTGVEGTIGFKKMDLVEGQYGYAAASKFGFEDGVAIPVEQTGNGYFTFTLYFRAVTENLDLKVNLTESEVIVGDSGNPEADAAAASASRIAFVLNEGLAASDWKVFEPNTDPGNGTYGEGLFFQKSNSMTPFQAYTSFLEVDSEDPTVYTFKADAVNNYGAVTSTVANSFIDLGQLTSDGTPLKVTVHIWLEGWDGDATNLAFGAQIKSFLKFDGVEVE